MQQQRCRCGVYRLFVCLQVLLGILVITVSVASLARFYTSGIFLATDDDDDLCRRFHASPDQEAPSLSAADTADLLGRIRSLHRTVDSAVRAMEKQVDLRDPAVLRAEYERFRRLITAEIKAPLDAIAVALQRLATLPPGAQAEVRVADLENFFEIEELRKYVAYKENRHGRANMLGVNGTYTAIGHGCFSFRKELQDYMSYDVGGFCNDDWHLAQKLMLLGCDPLPRRRCLARTPRLFQKPAALPDSLWAVPDDRNLRWDHYQCKNFSCLGAPGSRKGFFKCSGCFNLTVSESPKWVHNSSNRADFLISDVLRIKPREIRIGLDFSVGVGTFGARMREHNVTVVSTALNLGAPFNEMIALRGLPVLHMGLNQRLPFFDNTLDLIHSGGFLDAWIDFQMLDFVVFDWDRVLRPGGLLWIDKFFCSRRDLDDYLYMFLQLRYKKHKWVVVPKTNTDVFFSAVLEKPPRPF